jgi:hypothetical protein
MRFRRSIRIAKGFRINVSKSGLSASVGVPGASLTFGRRGTYLNTGIPGTGIYDRKRIGGSPASSGRARSSSGEPQTVVLRIKVELDESGNPEILGDDDRPITDEFLIRKIKRSDEFKAKVSELREQRREEIVRHTENFVRIYRNTPELIREGEIEEELEELTPDEYTPREFNVPPPDPEAIRAELEAEAKRTVHSLLFWKLGAMRQAYVDERLPRHHVSEVAHWEAEKAKFKHEEGEVKKRHDSEFLAAYDQRKRQLDDALAGTQSFVESEIEQLFGEIALPVDFSIQYQYTKADGKVDLDLDLPEIEDVPAEKAETLASGKLSIKKKTRKEIQEDYARCVLGLAFFFSGNVFNLSPAIHLITVAGYTQRTNPRTGHIEDQYVYSIRFDREIFGRLNVSEIDPLEAVSTFDHRVSLTKTLQMKTIQPFI